MTGETNRRTVLTGMGAAAVLGATGVAFAGEDEDGETDDQMDDDHGSGSVASVKALHASPDAPAVDVFVNGTAVLEDVSFGEISDYLVLLEGEYDVQVAPAGEGADAAVLDESVEVPAGVATAAVVGEVAEDGDQPLELLLLEVDVEDLDDGESRVRVLHASPDAPAVDVAVDGDVVFSDLSFGEAMSADVPAGEYELGVRPAGESDAVATFDAEFAAGAIYSAYAVGYLEPGDDEEAFDLLLDVDALTPDGEGDAMDDDDDSEDDDEAPTASVTFDGQKTHGSSVQVAETDLSDGGFVAIHDSSLLDGEVFGSVIGVTEYLEAGDHEDIEAHLFDEEMVDGAEFDQDELEEDCTLIAMPHLDTDDNEEYNFLASNGEEDGPYVDEDGNPVVDDAQVNVK
jgi:hypothetical protein